MPRRRRQIKSNTSYELCFRARANLPFVAYKIIDLFIAASIARTQRDDKIILCHDIWNGSHCHIVAVARDAQKFVNFYSELQKRITDALKKLLGLEYLQIWEGYPMVAEIADLEMAKQRINYLYSNPAQDDLEDSIDRFPGYSSWKCYQKCLNSLRATTEEKQPWIRIPSIPSIGCSELTPRQDNNLVRLLKRRNKEIHILKREPNAWMRCFGIKDDSEVQEINSEIVGAIKESEARERQRRVVQGKTVLGRRKLCSQPILKSHKPKKKSAKVFILSSINELRVQLIEEFKEFCEQCRDRYLRWMAGEVKIDWPPGAFKPPLPPTVSLLPEAY